MRGSVRTKLWASSAVVACRTKMSSGTLKRFTACSSFGTYRMRLLWETAIRPFVPQCSSYSSSLPSGWNRSPCRSMTIPASARMRGNCFPRSRSVK